MLTQDSKLTKCQSIYGGNLFSFHTATHCIKKNIIFRDINDPTSVFNLKYSLCGQLPDIPNGDICTYEYAIACCKRCSHEYSRFKEPEISKFFEHVDDLFKINYNPEKKKLIEDYIHIENRNFVNNVYNYLAVKSAIEVNCRTFYDMQYCFWNYYYNLMKDPHEIMVNKFYTFKRKVKILDEQYLAPKYSLILLSFYDKKSMLHNIFPRELLKLISWFIIN